MTDADFIAWLRRHRRLYRVLRWAHLLPIGEYR